MSYVASFDPPTPCSASCSFSLSTRCFIRYLPLRWNTGMSYWYNLLHSSFPSTSIQHSSSVICTTDIIICAMCNGHCNEGMYMCMHRGFRKVCVCMCLCVWVCVGVWVCGCVSACVCVVCVVRVYMCAMLIPNLLTPLHRCIFYARSVPDHSILLAALWLLHTESRETTEVVHI